MIYYLKILVSKCCFFLSKCLFFTGVRGMLEEDQKWRNVKDKLYQFSVGQVVVYAESENFGGIEELSSKIYSKYYFDSIAYAELIANSARTGKVKLEVEGYDISFCTGSVFFSGVLWLQFKVEGITLW